MMLKKFEQWPLIFAIGIAQINVFQAGVITGWSSPILSYLESENSPIPVTSEEGSWIASIMALVSLFCTPLAAASMHFLGRKLTILLTGIPFIIFWIMCSVATTTTELIIARGIVGLGLAFSYTVTPVYLGELSPDNIRGGIGICINVVTNIGTLWIYWIGTYPDLWLSSLTSAAPILLIILFYKWLPESPYYLVGINKKDEAGKVIKYINKSAKVDEEINKIESTFNVEGARSNVFKDIFLEPSHRRALMISIGTFTIAQMTGGVTFLFYAHLIFKKAGNVSANMMSMIKASLQLLTSIGAAYVVDNIGRKPLLIISCLGSSIFMICEGIYFYLLENDYNVDAIWWLPLVAMILFNISQVIGLASISIAYLGELFHPRVKSIAVCISKSYLAFCVFTVGKLYQVMSDNFGSATPFFVFAAVGVLGIIFVVFWVPETKGRSLEEIQYYMKNKSYRENTKL